MKNPHSALAGLHNVLAPASSPAHPVSLSRYATETWSRGGVYLGAAILTLLILAFVVAPALRRGRRASGN